MPQNRRLFLLGSVAFGLAACMKEAGSTLNEGHFGAATHHNTKLQSGEISLAEVMTRRFHAEVPSMVNFAFDSAELDGEALSILRRQADWMRQFPELRFKIYGHTDSVGSASYNFQLGQRRADAVLHRLVAFGVPRASILAVVSRGETQPLLAVEGYAPANRRTVTEISGLVRRGTIMQGEYAQIVQRQFVLSAQEAHVTQSPETQ